MSTHTVNILVLVEYNGDTSEGAVKVDHLHGEWKWFRGGELTKDLFNPYVVDGYARYERQFLPRSDEL